ncbi:adenosine receptor A2b-like [Orbicella faveolata]|uniref:adenosine receptor A2b-like n=1 Tax=Orbicella faveolata TaxID=48498 RepID=UPI0009E2C63C|nr:adenosine receptor A2b-like [Orbicella faveolata]
MNTTLQENDSSLDNCLECELQDCPVGLSQTSQVIFTSICLISGIFAIGGNFALLIAFYRTSALSTRVNAYFIASLAFADFMIGLTMTPLYICYAVAYDTLWLIKLEGYLWIVTVTATTYSLSAVSFDRFVAVVYPLRYHGVMTEKRCRAVIVFIWFGSVIFGSPRLVLDDFVKLEKLWITCSVATVAIPLTIMSCCYGKIFSVVRKQSRAVTDSHLSRTSVGNKKAAVTIGIIVSLFIATFLPSVVVYFMLLFENDLCKELILNDVWLWVALVSFTHSAFNPWVYGLRYRELRHALKQIFLKGNA